MEKQEIELYGVLHDAILGILGMWLNDRKPFSTEKHDDTKTSHDMIVGSFHSLNHLENWWVKQGTHAFTLLAEVNTVR